MSAREELLDLYRQWQRHTEAETAAIETDNWPELTRRQSLKVALQPRITVTAAHCEAANNTRPEAEPQFRSLVESLALLEQQNSTLLTRRIAAARGQLDATDRTTRTLRRVHRSYSHAPEAGWQTYS
ncbi:MAG: hypothetical protein HY300_10915 [Verrucomicrobia bacterium]|nr:hypothetical protein [Verrucomicrobiota bacterium]